MDDSCRGTSRPACDGTTIRQPQHDGWSWYGRELLTIIKQRCGFRIAVRCFEPHQVRTNPSSAVEAAPRACSTSKVWPFCWIAGPAGGERPEATRGCQLPPPGFPPRVSTADPLPLVFGALQNRCRSCCAGPAPPLTRESGPDANNSEL